MIRPDATPETYHEAWEADAIHAHRLRVFLRRALLCAAFVAGALAWWLL